MIKRPVKEKTASLGAERIRELFFYVFHSIALESAWKNLIDDI
jgi:hypothetical protein